MVQDWEYIRVFENKDGKEVILNYCYCRLKDGKWDRCPEKKGRACLAKCKIYVGDTTYELQEEKLKTLILHVKKKHIDCDEITFGKGHMHKALQEDIFTEKFIPELDEYDKSRCENKILLYEYPTYTIFPDGKQDNHKLGLYYERQQIEILRQLASKFKVLRHGIKGALSAIIVRNHSHHIGSHVMPRTTAERVRKRVIELTGLDENIENVASRIKGIEQKGKCEKELAIAEKQLGIIKKQNQIVDILKNKLDEYIQKKADFTAEIATEPMTTTKTMKFIDEVFSQFTENTLLMDNIGANEGVRYRNLGDKRLKINFLRGGRDWLYPEYESTKCGCPDLQEYHYSTKCFCGEDIQRKRDNVTENDISIALPGCLGEFAIYAFLENFIRNGIKHNKRDIDINTDNSYVVSIDICDLDDEFYELKIWDNFTKPENNITVNNDNGEDQNIKLCEYLQHLIMLPIVNNDGTLRKEAWGMSEMKIMATLLRGSTDFTNMAESLEITSEKRDGEQRLVYNLIIMKPKNVAIISDKEITSKNQEQNRHGIWWFKSTDELKDHVLKGRSPVSFKFLIIDKSEPDLDGLRHIKPLLPFRIMINEGCNSARQDSKWYRTISERDLAEIRVNNGSGILDIIWNAWMEKFIKSKGYSNISLLLFFEQEKSSEPTESWCSNGDEFTVQNNTINLSVLYKADKTNNKLSRECNDSKILMYDRHFGGFGYLDKNDKKSNIVFHEAFDKGSSDFIHISAPYRKEMVYELVETALLNVLVIDERIAEVAYDQANYDIMYANRAYGGVQKILIAKKAGIFICTHICINNNTDPQSLHQSINDKIPIICVKFNVYNTHNAEINVNTNIFYCVEKKCSTCNGRDIDMDAVIIHQGVLENFFKGELQGDKNKYNKFLESLQESIPYVIIDSGRGIPAKLPDKAKFLPFSMLEEFIMKDRIAKYSLTKNIMSLSRRK